jgi:pyridoxal phosphate-dependent aminotransferase EpsN
VQAENQGQKMPRVFLSAPDISGQEKALVNEVFASNYVAPIGKMLTRFERDMCAYTGIKNAVALTSGTAALQLALRIAGIGHGDDVWTTSMTFIGGVSPITFVGARPVFFDLDPGSWTIDVRLIDDQLSKAAKTGKLPKAIVTTDLYGQSCDLDAILALGAQYGVEIISDSAEALGAKYKGRHAGAGAKSTILSFNGNKIITTSGGGMLLSDDKAIIDKARFLSTQAREPEIHYEHKEIGYNYRLSNVCAAIGVGQLEMIEQKVDRRRAIFDCYVSAFAGLPGVSFMPEPGWSRCTRWLTAMTIDPSKAGTDRHRLLKACSDADIEVRPLWKPMHMQPVFAGSAFVGTGVCETLFDTGLCLPSGSGMTAAEQDRVIKTMLAEFESSSA